ncbi:hypothetical protein [Neisseria weaveri]|uniref:hypothetical protein n=1 Tax=Neisseria weaveri TaxID=28091 RepID=UPI000D302046|nr:hypothetical protein [Neisseria weaveri]
MCDIVDEYVLVIGKFVSQELNNLDYDYKWKKINLNSSRDYIDININLNTKESLAKQNLHLRQQLHEKWKVASIEEKKKLAEWYVKKWGGISRISNKNINSYVECEPQNLIAMKGVDKISSWSKVLSILDPESYVIFDTRVSFSINALLLIEQCETGYCLGLSSCSRNGTIKPAFKKLKQKIQELEYNEISDKKVYLCYLNALKKIADEYTTSIQKIEMLLFAHAEKLATVILDD